ncbi:cytidylate kinase [Rubritalea squalenifaciens DSM 18772]|uniref:Cytidylate kinase n=1 Tax=Rubritalea squalenifaciens DSM 18772 TaxID=1123071 RepID=A0A1M6RQG6_9BACT|nr:(d)CMP kinase [Rubritalea squalenifaciens]SHK34761.1 cytidylate kinase [Rubritalea squalenifaciens DSM 18772]
MENIAIAIDGPAASGKSTVAKTLAKRLGLIMVNTGAMYRAVAWATIQKDVDPADSEAVIKMLGEVEFSCGVSDNLSTILVDGVDPGDALRQDAVNQRVSKVAAIPEVRELLVQRQRDYLQLGSVVMEGRDIGSVVFPDTPFKIYIDASEEVRRQRRAAEGIVDELGKRDEEDSKRKTAPLVVAEGAVKIDSSELSIEQVIERVLEILKERGAPAELLGN